MLIHGLVDNDLYPPRFGGTQRSFGLYRGLARRASVQVLCVVPNRCTAPREEIVAGVTLLRRKAWYTSLAWGLERARLAPLQAAAELHTRRARALLRELPGRPDVRAADLPMCGLLAHSPARCEVYMAHNVEADFFATTSAGLAFGAAWRARIRERERRAVETADLTVAASDEDAARMVSLHGADPARVEVIPNGYDETEVRPPSAEERARARAALGLGPGDYAALLVGSDAPHNLDAARALAEAAGPALAAAGIVVIVAGRVARAISPSGPRGWRVLGEVDDLRPVLHAADAGLNPVLRGGGSNVKVPTYLAAGLAVVSTGFGMRGYASLAPWVQAAEVDRFADALAARPRGWAALGEAMPAAVSDHAWGRLGERLAERLEHRLAATGADGNAAGAQAGVA